MATKQIPRERRQANIRTEVNEAMKACRISLFMASRNGELYRGEGRPDPVERQGSRIRDHDDHATRTTDADRHGGYTDGGHVGVNVSWSAVAQAGIGTAPGIGVEGGISYVPDTGEISATGGVYLGMAGVGVMAGALTPSVSLFYQSGPESASSECVQRIIVASPLFVVTVDQSIQTPGAVSVGGAAGLSFSLGFFTGYFCGTSVEIGTAFGSEEELRTPFAP